MLQALGLSRASASSDAATVCSHPHSLKAVGQVEAQHFGGGLVARDLLPPKVLLARAAVPSHGLFLAIFVACFLP